METNEELIKGARAVGTNDVVANPRRYWGMIRELADALEAATAVETGWEYGTAHREDPQVGAVEWSRARAEERVREWNETTQSVTGFVVRRRAAGPWLPVEGECSDEA
ncbi:hypothetical protein [Leucobacter sp. G161]|uniref:hypothetical protein n=1 Tax=Leucobacter sp. G161 TaxID=663704 RepID=UPI00073C74D1|nr:hypothetical protein [Leucobacter sp. G161]KUF05682.1 hypothetical protein AUL38_15930 [Leucobacter sp. G161]